MRFREAPEVMIFHELTGFKLLLGLLMGVLGKKGLGVPRASCKVTEVWDVNTILGIEYSMIVVIVVIKHIFGTFQDAVADCRKNIGL
jgi:hypothetical protein